MVETSHCTSPVLTQCYTDHYWPCLPQVLVLAKSNCAWLTMQPPSHFCPFHVLAKSNCILPQANECNIQTTAAVWHELSFFFDSCFFLFLSFNCQLTPQNIPKVDDLVFGKVLARGHWKVSLQQVCDLCILVSPVSPILCIFAKPFFCLVIVMMCNLLGRSILCLWSSTLISL